MFNVRVSTPSAVVISLTLLAMNASAKLPVANSPAPGADRDLAAVEQSAAAVKADADRLRAGATDAEDSPDWHAELLTRMRERINRMSAELRTLEAERGQLPVWQQEAIAKTLPLLNDSATNTQSAIDYFNTNRDLLWSDAYRDYLDRIWKDSETMANTLHDYRNLAKLRREEHRLDSVLDRTNSE